MHNKQARRYLTYFMSPISSAIINLGEAALVPVLRVNGAAVSGVLGPT
jgi:hypothetical protein